LPRHLAAGGTIAPRLIRAHLLQRVDDLGIEHSRTILSRMRFTGLALLALLLWRALATFWLDGRATTQTLVAIPRILRGRHRARVRRRIE